MAKLSLRAVLGNPFNLLVLAVVAVIAYLGITPLAFTLYGSLRQPSSPFVPGVFSLNNYVITYTSSENLASIYNTIVYIAFSTVLSLGLGFAFAFLVLRTNTFMRGIFAVLAVVPLVFPPFLNAMMWILLLNPRNGWINLFLMYLLHLDTGPLNIFSMAGMVLVKVFATFPLAFLTISAAMASMDPALEEASLVAGAGVRYTVWNITLKLLKPGVLSALLLLYVIGLGDFQIPLLLGSPAGINVLATRVYKALNGGLTPDYGLATALSTILLLLSIVGIYLQMKSVGNVGRRYATIRGKGLQAKVVELGRWRFLAFAVLAVFFSLIIFLPTTALLYTAFAPYFSVPTVQLLGKLSFDNFATVLASNTFTLALTNTLILGFLAPTITVLMVSISSYVSVRTNIRGRKIVDVLTIIPLATPDIVIAVGLTWLYLWARIGVYATIWILLIAYCTRLIPITSRMVTGTMYQADPELEEQSRVAGASQLKTFARIILPLTKHGVLFAWSYGSIEYLREFTMSLFLYSYTSVVLSVLLFSYWSLGQYTTAAAMAVILLVISVTTMIFARRFLGFSLAQRAG